MGLFSRRTSDDAGSSATHAYLHQAAMDLVPRAHGSHASWTAQVETNYPSAMDAFRAVLPAVTDLEQLRGESRALSEVAAVESNRGTADPQLATLIDQTYRAMESDWNTVARSCGMLLFFPDENVAEPASMTASEDRDRKSRSELAAARFEGWWAQDHSELLPSGTPTAREKYEAELLRIGAALGRSYSPTQGNF